MTALRVAVVGSSALLLIGSFAVTGSAAPAAETPQLGVADLPPELAEAIARDLHLTPEQYLDRAARAQDLGTYARSFRNDHPDVFAGAWMGQDGDPVVAVTTDEAARIAERDGYRTARAPISAEGLERSLAELNRWVAKLPRQVSSQINSLAIDALNNQIVVDVANSPVGRALNLPTLLANVKVVLSPGGGGPVEQKPMAGDSYVSTAAPLPDTPLADVTVCSFGFNAIGADGTALNISAGHCDANDAGARVYLPNARDIDASPQIGSFVRASLGEPVALDYGLIALNSAGVGAGLDAPTVRGANGTTLPITGTAAPVVGAPVCKSGQTSTFTCGFVVADRVESVLFSDDGSSRIVRGFASTACTLAGDSGGAIVSGTLALGITSGSNASLAPNCETANLVLAQHGGTASLGIPIREILADANATYGTQINLRTTPNAA